MFWLTENMYPYLQMNLLVWLLIFWWMMSFVQPMHEMFCSAVGWKLLFGCLIKCFYLDAWWVLVSCWMKTFVRLFDKMFLSWCMMSFVRLLDKKFLFWCMKCFVQLLDERFLFWCTMSFVRLLDEEICSADARRVLFSCRMKGFYFDAWDKVCC